jgi:type IV pilus assembly protein PilN
MIKVNLIPARRKRKPKPVPAFVIASVLLLVFALVGFLSYSYFLDSKIQDLQAQKAANARKLAELNEKIKEVKGFEALNRKFQQRKEIIERLTKNQSVPVKILDEMNKRLTDGIWLRSMSISGDRISVDGFGFTNSDIVSYVQNLKDSKLFQDVVLLETRRTGDKNVELYSFKLDMQVKA